MATSAKFMAMASSRASSMAEGYVNAKVNLGKVRVLSSHALEITDVKAQNLDGSPLFTAKRVEITFDPLAILQGYTTSAVQSITVDTPAITLHQDAQGHWDVQDLLKGTSGSTVFHAKVHAEHGQADVFLPVGEIRVQDITADAAFSSTTSVNVEASFQSNGASFQTQGSVVNGEQNFTIEAKNIQAADYLPFVPQNLIPPDVQPLGATIDDLNVKGYRAAGVLHFTGSAHIENARAKVFQADVLAPEIYTRFTEKQAQVYARAMSAGQSVSVNGRVNYGDTPLTFNLSAESSSFDPKALFAISPWQGAASFVASAYGTMDNLKIDASFQAKQGDLQGIAVRNVQGKAHFEDNILGIDNLQGEAMGGTFRLAGGIGVKDLTYHLHATAQGLSGAELSAFSPEPFTGTIDADTILSGQGLDINNLTVYGTAEAQNVTARGITAQQAATSFFLSKQNLHLDYLGLSFADDGELGITGDVNPEKVNVAFYGSNVPLSLANDFSPLLEASGHLEVKGAVQGSLQDPKVSLNLQARTGKILKQPFDLIELQASGSLSGVAIDSFALWKDGREQWTASGTVGLTGEKALNVRVDAMGARMENIAALVAPDQPITGDVDNTIRFQGTLDNPSAVGYVHFYLGSYAGYILSGMDGDYFLENGVVRLQDFHVFSPMVDVDLNGTVTQAGDLHLQAVAHDISLERIGGGKLPYPVSGHAKFTGNINGSVYAPIFDGFLTAPTLDFNGREIKDVDGALHFADNILQLSQFAFAEGSGNYRLTGETNIATGSLTGTMTIQDGDVGALLAVANLKNDALKGKINGDVTLTGSWENPAGSLHLTLSQASCAGYALQDTEANLSLQNHLLTIDHLRGGEGDGIFAAAGTIPLDGGSINAQFSAQNIDAGMVTAALGLTTQVTGKLNVEVQGSGTLQNPGIDASVSVLDGGIGASRFDSLTGLFNYHQGVINVRQLLAQKKVAEQTYRIGAKGYIPLGSLIGQDAHAPNMDLTLSLDEADLSLLPTFTNAVEWAIGPMQGTLHLGGTLQTPKLDGSLGFTGGALKLRFLDAPITDMQMRLNFHDSTMTLEDFSGVLGKGTYKVTGSARLHNMQLTGYQLEANLNHLGITSDFYNGPLSGDLQISEGQIFGHPIPRLSGRILIENALISIPTLPDTQGALPNALLDLHLNLGQRVRFYSPSLYDMRLIGNAHFGGTTLHPQTSGTISALHGSITYNQTQFNLQEAEATFNQFDSFFPSLNLIANARIGRIRLALNVSGPLENMNVQLTSNPPMDEADLLRLLTFQNEDADPSWSSLLNLGFSMTVLGVVENSIRNALGLDEFRIAGEEVEKFNERDTGSASNGLESEYKVELGKYISDKVMLRYKQGLNGRGQEYGMIYDLNDRMSLYLDRGRGKDYVFGVEARVRF